MNYYPFHIGDFAAHTSHLTWEEDIAYRRMLDWYYLNEKSLPGDPVKVARLIRMPKSKTAIDTVLAEFFVLSEDGYHNKRADDELTGMKAKQEQQSTKDEHEAERLRRYRARRADIFAALRAQCVIPAWDVPMKELQRLFDTHCNAPETRTGSLPETGQQRLSIPTPTPTPTPVKEKAAPASLTLADLVADGLDEEVATAWLAHRKAKKAKLTPLAWAGFKVEVTKAGWQIDDAVRKAITRGWIAFEAEWVKTEPNPAIKNFPTETTYQRSMRERMELVVPSIAAKRPGGAMNPNPMEILDGLTRIAR